MASQTANQALQATGHASRWVLRLTILTVLTVATLAGLAFSPLADVERVDIVGLHRLTLDEVEGSLNFGPGVALIRLNFGPAHEALERLTWFESASFSREWNGIVTVRVTEQRPVALALNGSGEWVMVSHEGRVLSEPLSSPPAFASVLGIVAAGETGEYLPADTKPLFDIIIALRLSGVAHDQVWFDQRNDIWLDLASGDRVALGDETQLVAKLASLMTLLDELGLDELEGESRSGRVLELDVSVPYLPVVRELRELAS